MMNKLEKIKQLENAKRFVDNLEIDIALPLIYSLIDCNIVEAYGLLAYIYNYEYQKHGKYTKEIIDNAYKQYYIALEKDFHKGNLLSGMKLAGALRFYMSNHIVQDDEKALSIYQKCAKEGLNEAKIILAEIYKEGDLGTMQDINKYLNLMQSAAFNGSVEAMHELGIAFLNKNQQIALYWIKKAANLGYWQSIEYLEQLVKKQA